MNWVVDYVIGYVNVNMIFEERKCSSKKLLLENQYSATSGEVFCINRYSPSFAGIHSQAKSAIYSLSGAGLLTCD
jgi:hypothetical protein